MQMSNWLRGTVAALALTLVGCSTVNVNDYAGERPALDFRAYFNGSVKAWGILQNRSGKVTKRFVVEIDAKWSGDTGTLDEHFVYADGTRQRRVWTVRQAGEGRFIGTADDVIGEAIGEAAGNAIRWRYVLAVPVDGKVYHVDMDDWMYLMDDRVLLNRTSMSKFGFHLGDLTLTFDKR